MTHLVTVLVSRSNRVRGNPLPIFSINKRLKKEKRRGNVSSVTGILRRRKVSPMANDELIIEGGEEGPIKGTVIDSGWQLFKACFPPEMPPEQINAWRNCFFLGAQHMLSSVIVILDPEKEATEADLVKLDSIVGEMNDFEETLRAAAAANPH
jgi:hypothetical protein